MKTTVAILLVVASLVSAEPPRFRSFARQSAPPADVEDAPYAPSGWRPSGQQFTLPQRPQPQQTYGAPIADQGLYNAPQQPSSQYGPPEEEATTESAAEDITEATVENLRNADKKSEKLQEPQNPAFFIIPQPERLVYAVQTAPLVTLPQAKYVTAANLQALPLTGVQAPQYTSAYVQLYK